MTLQELFKQGMKRDIPELLWIDPDYNPAIKSLELGPGNSPVGTKHVLEYPEWDAENGTIPFGDATMDIIYAYNFFEHINNPVDILRECDRVLRTGGIINICVPHSSGLNAFEDLDHKKFFNEETWRVLLENDWYDKDHRGWKLKIHLNIIMAVKHRNLTNFVQLVKTS